MRQKDVFWFWLPLFASWLLMTMEGPFVTATINRLPNEVIMLAAMGIVVSLSVTIESPIINLLATSTALVKDRASFLQVRRFNVHWMIFLTAVTFLIAFTPVFDFVVVRLLGTPAEIAVWVQPGLKILLFWSAAIAWRRFLQGVLIHFNQPKKVAWGSVLRLISSAGTAVILGVWSGLPGVIIGATALMMGVLAEAIYATVAVRPLLKTELSPTAAPAAGDPLTYRELFWFHLPLAGTSVLILFTQPLVTSSLARLQNPTLSLAAWPVLFQIMLMARAAAFALPEVIIALTKNKESYRPLRRFSFNLAFLITGVMLLFTVTPISTFYIFVVQDMTGPVGSLVKLALIFFLFFPALTVIDMWLRGVLIHGRHTKDVNIAMGINLGVTAVVLGIGMVYQAPGLPTAAIALNAAIICEIIYLLWRTHRFVPLSLPSWGRLSPSPTC